jgi:hypothetical protein
MGKIIEAERFRAIAEGNGSAAAGAVTVFRGSVYVGTAGDGIAESAEPPKIMRLSSTASDWEVVLEPPLMNPVQRFFVPSLGQ